MWLQRYGFFLEKECRFGQKDEKRQGLLVLSVLLVVSQYVAVLPFHHVYNVMAVDAVIQIALLAGLLVRDDPVEVDIDRTELISALHVQIGLSGACCLVRPMAEP